MAKNIPFDDDAMTLIMGLGSSEEPGQHGKTKTIAPGQDAVSTIIQIRDLCEEFLSNSEENKEENEEEPEAEPEENEEE